MDDLVDYLSFCFSKLSVEFGHRRCASVSPCFLLSLPSVRLASVAAVCSPLLHHWFSFYLGSSSPSWSFVMLIQCSASVRSMRLRLTGFIPLVSISLFTLSSPDLVRHSASIRSLNFPWSLSSVRFPRVARLIFVPLLWLVYASWPPAHAPHLRRSSSLPWLKRIPRSPTRQRSPHQ